MLLSVLRDGDIRTGQYDLLKGLILVPGSVNSWKELLPSANKLKFTDWYRSWMSDTKLKLVMDLNSQCTVFFSFFFF